MIETFKIDRASGIPFSVNNIMGFQHETAEMAFDTVRLNKVVDSWDRNAYHFSPFHGTPLREECAKLGYVKNEALVQSFVTGDSLLDMPQFPKSRGMSPLKTCNMDATVPQERCAQIR